ncbi:MAG: hypothetical protein HPY75_07340 [Actinobacteria bacterium]|nr:hypothetical protein [Actinomycetota bacterium]
MLLVNFIGPIFYLAWGRHPADEREGNRR